MTVQTDEDEHSIELHLPYVRKVFEATNGGMLGLPCPPSDVMSNLLLLISAHVILINNNY